MSTHSLKNIKHSNIYKKKLKKIPWRHIVPWYPGAQLKQWPVLISHIFPLQVSEHGLVQSSPKVPLHPISFYKKLTSIYLIVQVNTCIKEYVYSETSKNYFDNVFISFINKLLYKNTNKYVIRKYRLQNFIPYSLKEDMLLTYINFLKQMKFKLVL